MVTRKKKSKTVFILGGGAALGSHQAGALRCLEERGIRPDAIVGSSIGVVNSCVYATGGARLVEEAWSKFRSLPSIVTFSLRQNLLLGKSIFSQKKLHDRIERSIDFPKIFEGPLDLEFIMINLSRGEAMIRGNRTEKSWEDFRTVSRCGYAIPILFPPVRHDGDYWVDGAFAWNIPLSHAVKKGA
ncbi:MAG: patatin-like phospholipase family protein, partial [Vicinamibacteria bacterium]